MRFTSISYFLFFIIYFSCFCFLKPYFRLHLVVVGSIIFYAWLNPIMIWVPIVLCSVGFWGASWIAKDEVSQVRKARFWVLIVALISPLIYYKYKHFLYNEIFVPVTGVASTNLQAALPLGISFMTFTIICYVVDVCQKKFPPSQSLSHVFAYMLFFPHLIAGPILRPAELIPQLLRGKAGRISSIGFGLTLFTVGLTKKIIFADSLGGFVDPVFAEPAGHNLLTYWLAIFGYALQIYCDFSGYTDMAIGAAKILGVQLPINFNKPYIACSLQDFWRRWHMTLSRWLRDYLYIPLGGNRCSKPRYLSNIIVTMALCGIWHGANWTFLLWGILHGIGLALSSTIKFSRTATSITEMLPRPLKWFLTSGFLVLTWVVFRAPNIGTAKIILIEAFTSEMVYDTSFFKTNALYILLLGLFAISHRFDSMRNIRFMYRKMNKAVIGVLIITTWAICIAASTASSKSFIYFDF
jgi:alginate O-acetyltransferase complex protein AlgI